MQRSFLPFVSAVSMMAATSAFAGSFASGVVGYEQGTDATAGYTDPNAAIGSATRTTGFDLRVTPFNPAFSSGELVSIGRGGWLTLEFSAPITDDAVNPYGIDLLIFGNSFFYADDFSPIANNLWKPGGVVEVSLDGSDWRTVPGAIADGLFPTMGWQDTTDPFGSDGGSIATDFHTPVDPSFSPWGKTFSELQAGYGTSGGGAGIDLSVVGLAAAKYVRISNPTGSAYAIEIDAIADVIPAPSTFAAVLFGAGLAARKRQR
jgi:hypothetical protein